jgi:hypothetical protein
MIIAWYFAEIQFGDISNAPFDANSPPPVHISGATLDFFMLKIHYNMPGAC